MKNKALVTDYLTRCQHRLEAVELLHSRESWADVVRESQEIVELALKALLRWAQIEVPRIHDVSQILSDQKALFPDSLKSEIEKLGEISRDLRRDRELAFYGSEDLTPSEFYRKADAERAKANARFVVDSIRNALRC